MSKLTDEQLDLAAKEFWSQERWADWYVDHQRRVGEHAKKGLRAAAPFLQMPWDEPNQFEVDEACAYISRAIVGGSSPAAIRGAMSWLVKSRNAALLPKSVDPRVEKVARAIFCYKFVDDTMTWEMCESRGESRELYYRMAEAVIAALDEVK